jgi:hypothetical protein
MVLGTSAGTVVAAAVLAGAPVAAIWGRAEGAGAAVVTVAPACAEATMSGTTGWAWAPGD